MKTFIFKTNTYLDGCAGDIGLIRDKHIRAENADEAFTIYQQMVMNEDHVEVSPETMDEIFDDPYDSSVQTGWSVCAFHSTFDDKGNDVWEDLELDIHVFVYGF